MERDEENKLSNEVKDLGDSASLCTLCVLETCPDAYRRSPRFSPPEKLATINETSLIESLELDGFPKFVDTRDFEKFDEASLVMRFSVSNLRGKNLAGYREPSPPSFIDDDDEDLFSQSLRDILERLDPAINREEPTTIAKLSQRLSQQCFSENNVSDPVGIAPKISADLVRKIVDDGARSADLNLRFYDPDGHEEKKQAEVNDEKILNVEPARSYKSDIPDDVIPCKRRKLNEEPSRDKEKKRENSPIDDVSKIPRKKPKIVSDEIVVGYPIKIILSHSDEKIASVNVAADETKNGNFHLDDEVQVLEEKIEKRKEAEKEDTEKKKIDKCWKNLEGVVEISRSLKIPPQILRLDPVKSQKQKLPNLKTLQRNIDKGSKKLYETASDMAELSLLIDNVRNYYTPKETSKQLKPVKKDASKTLVSTATQTKEQVSSENPLPSADDGIKDPDKRSTKIDESLFRPSSIKVPKNRENDRETVRKRFFTFADKMKMEKKFQMERKTKIVDKREGITLNRNVIVDEYEQYWNPLRPHRWPKNRNNPQPLRNYSSPCQFPSLPVVIESPKVALVTKSAK